MKDRTLFVGMDVHKETISVSVLESRGHEARPTVTIANRPSTVRQVFEKLRKEGEVHAAYEAGCCGYVLHRDLTQLGVDCQVIAPSLIPVRPGDRVKTDRRDAEKLARLLRAGELTAIRVPTPAEESLRDLVRCREDAREDGRRDKHRVLKFLLRHGRIYDQGRHWTEAHWRWLRAQRFEQPMTHGVFLDYVARLDSTLSRVKQLDARIAEAAEQPAYKPRVARLRCLRGVDTLIAVTLVAEICDFNRFEHAQQFMAFVGLVPSERSSGGSTRRGSITKAGNGHVRKLLVEAAWAQRHPPRRSPTMKARWRGQPEPVVAHAYKAQERLHRRFLRLTSRGKPSQVAIIAVARELCGFVWAIARTAA
jgi:transposase